MPVSPKVPFALWAAAAMLASHAPTLASYSAATILLSSSTSCSSSSRVPTNGGCRVPRAHSSAQPLPPPREKCDRKSGSTISSNRLPPLLLLLPLPAGMPTRVQRPSVISAVCQSSTWCGHQSSTGCGHQSSKRAVAINHPQFAVTISHISHQQGVAVPFLLLSAKCGNHTYYYSDTVMVQSSPT